MFNIYIYEYKYNDSLFSPINDIIKTYKKYLKNVFKEKENIKTNKCDNIIFELIYSSINTLNFNKTKQEIEKKIIYFKNIDDLISNIKSTNDDIYLLTNYKIKNKLKDIFPDRINFITNKVNMFLKYDELLYQNNNLFKNI